MKIILLLLTLFSFIFLINGSCQVCVVDHENSSSQFSTIEQCLQNLNGCQNGSIIVKTSGVYYSTYSESCEFTLNTSIKITPIQSNGYTLISVKSFGFLNIRAQTNVQVSLTFERFNFESQLKNSYAFQLSASQGSNSLLNITDGNAQGFQLEYESGAFVNSNGFDVIAKQFQFSNHLALNGGVFYVNSGQLTLQNVIMNNNTAINNGGAVYSQYTVILDSTIFGNRANQSGGAVYTQSLTVMNSYIGFQMASWGGSIFMNTWTSDEGENQLNVYIYNSTVTYSNAQSGGLMYIAQTINHLSISYSNFTHGYAQSGGAIYYIGSKNTNNWYFQKTYFDFNNASIGSGGAIFSYSPLLIYGGIFRNSSSTESQIQSFPQFYLKTQNWVSVADPSDCQSRPAISDYSSTYICLNVFGTCEYGLAVVDKDSNVVSCSCDEGFSGSDCSQFPSTTTSSSHSTTSFSSSGWSSSSSSSGSYDSDSYSSTSGSYDSDSYSTSTSGSDSGYYSTGSYSGSEPYSSTGSYSGSSNSGNSGSFSDSYSGSGSYSSSGSYSGSEPYSSTGSYTGSEPYSSTGSYSGESSTTGSESNSGTTAWSTTEYSSSSAWSTVSTSSWTTSSSSSSTTSTPSPDKPNASQDSVEPSPPVPKPATYSIVIGIAVFSFSLIFLVLIFKSILCN
ncbi:hypothetical protein DLAC_03136 [Tieghemostelium lacteum]|uniref:EGF-like domain-containing protein n=1 Tax=Tieghemostelium lacteum TaxID=361077 RepID=A0A152A2C3_TIELA|nr:hypothetical protein DLAC_03136 [Tieghemostelium lacteum]|eukprot:KYR00388.1 hypothetical protein DLAC_03136 [Tieghemostelium lacteum]